MFPVIPILFLLLATGVGCGVVKMLSGKKTLITGPKLSGKTTFIQHISKEKIPDGPSGAPRSFKVKDAMLNEVTDFSGDASWLKSRFNEYIKDHDYILFFFDTSEYIKDEPYRVQTNARIDMIHRNVNSSQKVLIIGTHIDKLSGSYKADIERFFAGKSYQSVLNHIVYVDTTKKECVETIINELKR